MYANNAFKISFDWWASETRKSQPSLKSKSILIHTRINKNLDTDIENNNDDYSSDEDEFGDEPSVYIKLHETFINSLFIQNEKDILLCLRQIYSEVGSEASFFVLIPSFSKLLGYMLKKENKWKYYD